MVKVEHEVIDLLYLILAINLWLKKYLGCIQAYIRSGLNYMLTQLNFHKKPMH
jgi:hypothetical protein